MCHARDPQALVKASHGYHTLLVHWSRCTLCSKHVCVQKQKYTVLASPAMTSTSTCTSTHAMLQETSMQQAECGSLPQWHSQIAYVPELTPARTHQSRQMRMPGQMVMPGNAGAGSLGQEVQQELEQQEWETQCCPFISAVHRARSCSDGTQSSPRYQAWKGQRSL